MSEQIVAPSSKNNVAHDPLEGLGDCPIQAYGVEDDETDSAKPKRRRFKLTPIREALKSQTPIRWQVRHLFEMESLVQIFGPTGGSKTFAVLSLAIAIALGRDWFGSPVKQGVVVYVAGEGRNGVLRRVQAVIEHDNINDEEPLPLHVSEGSTAILESQAFAELLEECDAVKEREGSVDLLILDTLHRNFGVGDENSAKDFSAFIERCDEIKNRYGCTVLWVHHVGHEASGRARGSSSIRAGLDWEHVIRRNDAGLIEMQATKAKECDLAEIPHRFFTLVQVELSGAPKNDDGTPATSAVLVEATGNQQADDMAKLPKSIRDLLWELPNVWAAFATPAPSSIADITDAPPVRVVDMSEVVRHLADKVSKAENPQHRRDACNRAIKKAVEAGKMARVDNKLFPLDERVWERCEREYFRPSAVENRGFPVAEQEVRDELRQWAHAQWSDDWSRPVSAKPEAVAAARAGKAVSDEVTRQAISEPKTTVAAPPDFGGDDLDTMLGGHDFTLSYDHDETKS